MTKFVGFILIFLVVVVIAFAEARNFSIDWERNEFLKDGEIFRYIAGEMHYFQVPPELWRERLKKMKYGGLNTLQTYIEWNKMEPSLGVYDFSHQQNITAYIEMAQQEGLLVIVRVGPYIDAERDMGGLPSWLLRDHPDIKLRTSDPKWIQPLDRWLKKLLPMLRPLLYHNGGPIIMVQPENEYGSYKPACETAGDYKAYMRDTFREILGEETVLFTTDGNADHFLKCGMIPEVFATIDFDSGSDVEASFASLRRFQAKGPLVNSEYYSGWIDHWEHPHSTATSAQVAATLDKMLAMNVSVTIYMYHGGTNYGFSAGSNDPFLPLLTSYDFDAPISEAGDLTPKFFALKEVIKKYFPVKDEREIPAIAEKMQLPPTEMERKADIFNLLPLPIHSELPQSFEQLNHSYGFMLYTTNLTFQATDPAILNVPGLHDRAHVFVNREFAGVLSLTQNLFQLPILARKGAEIAILVENQGRLAYGNNINVRKGILSNVTIDGINMLNWNHYRLYDNWDDVLSKLQSTKPQSEPQERIPAFYKGTFQLPDKANYPADSFLQVSGWTKGQAFLNGFNLGRYWPVAGPQETLYAPSVYFKKYPQQNEIVLLELEHSPCSIKEKCTIQFVQKHVINGTVPAERH